MKLVLSTIPVITCAFFMSCTDILNTAPYNKPASSTMWTSENLTDMGVAAVYAQLRNITSGSYGQYAWDEWGCMGHGRSSGGAFNGTITASNSAFSSLWSRAYEGIHRANDAIFNIPDKSPVAEAKKARLVAECKFLRAFYYYRLNELFRGVPIYLEPIKVEECIRTQETEEAVWLQIIDDLTDCINEPNIPDIDRTTGRVTKGAAYALRGKTYLHRKKYAEAAADFAKVGDCGYELFQGGFKELFAEANERCKEMIFSVQNISDVGYGGTVQFYTGTRSSFGSCWNSFLVSANGVDMYECTDGKPFDWDNIIPGFKSMEAKQREVYFLRDTEGASQNVINAVNTRLNALSAEAQALYLPSGNEDRIRQAYLNRDPRLGMSVITPYSTYLGVYANADLLTTLRWPFVNEGNTTANIPNADLWTDSNTQFHYLHRKFVYEGNNPVGLPGRDRVPIDEPLIRYADVLLSWAEALVELDMLAEAAAKVNMVRGRKSVEMPDVIYADKDELRAKVRNERRVEFMNEGVNFFDEMRWRTWKESKFDVGGLLYCWGAVHQPFVWPGDHYYVWPAPVTEVERNPNLKKTAGWIY